MTQKWSRSFRLFVLAGGTLALVWLAWYARAMIAPLLISALLAYVLNPAVTALSSVTRLSHRAAVIVVYLGGLALLGAIPAILTPVLLGEARTLALDLEQIATDFADLRSREVLLFGDSISLARLLPEVAPLSLEWLTPVAEHALQLLETTTRNLAWVLVILVTPYYLLQDWERVRELLIRLAPEDYQSDVRQLYQEIKAVWAAYLRGQLALMLVVAVIFSLAWLAIGLPGAVILGLLTGLFSLVPELGPTVAAVLAVLVALLGGSTYLPLSRFWFAVLTTGVYLVLINVKNIWLRPRFLGRSVRLNEGLVFVAIIGAVVLQGILGALIVVPVMASAGVMGRYLRRRVLGLPPFPAEESLPPVQPAETPPTGESGGVGAEGGRGPTRPPRIPPGSGKMSSGSSAPPRT